MQFHGPEANIANAVQKLSAGSHGGAPDAAPGAMPAWQQALVSVHLPLYDVHWERAVVLRSGKRDEEALRVGLTDGRIVPLVVSGGRIRRSLNPYDVVYVRVIAGRGGDTSSSDRRTKATAHAKLRVRPTVQGAALVLENKTGRILAMVGSFSYPLSQLNRTTQTQRQPGSAIKPLTYLTALQKGLQPNTLVLGDPITLPPVGARGSGAYGETTAPEPTNAREEDYWKLRNAGNDASGIYTIRRGLENSVNTVTARLLDGGIETNPEGSLDDICATAVAAKIYTDCVRYYPFVLGAQPVRMINLAAFYSAIANEGARPQPHAIESIEASGRTIYKYPNTSPPTIGAAADHASFYQLKTMLQGVVARGTARAISELSPYVAGKTGTTEDSVDGWFIGFTNDVTIAVWVGYDNGDGKRRSLGSAETGAKVALPIFEPIVNAVWSENIAPKAPLSGPSSLAQSQLVDHAIDFESGDRMKRGRGFIEHFRVGPKSLSGHFRPDYKVF
jgi:penicillin-binding protein 1A